MSKTNPSSRGLLSQLFIRLKEITSGAATETRTVTGFTLRISNIPSSITKEQFRDIFNCLPTDAPQTDNVLGYSFTLPAASPDRQRYRTATVTFRFVPLRLKKLCATPIDLFERTSSTVVDSHFYGLTPLNDPSERPIADIIAVAGLAGHAFGSWKSRSGYRMWLRDFLPAHVRNARILTYGYDSTLYKNNSDASIIEFSQSFLQALQAARSSDEERSRPIVFIGHSLGGLVIKHALVAASQSSRSSEDSFIFSSCHALLLFGVPHEGLQAEGLRTMVKGQPNSRLIEDLNYSSNFLRLLDQTWKSIQRKNTRVVSVYETKPTPTVQETPTGWKRTGPEVIMVSQNSATHATPQEKANDIFSIDANHSDIVKFDHDGCQDYINVRLKIMDLVQDVHDMSMGYIFVEREKRYDLLKWLSKIEYIKHHENAKEGLLESTGLWLLKRGEFRTWWSSKISSILWLHGIPGAGKTKLTCMIIDTLKSWIKNLNISNCQEYGTVVYFYCNRNEPLRQDPEIILQAIVKQLCLARPDLQGLPQEVVAKYDKRVEDGLASGPLGFQESCRLILSLLRLYSRTAIIIDGLDECDPEKRWRLLGALNTIIQPISSAGLVRVFISSRDDTDITLKLGYMPNLYINAGDNAADIERFVNREVSQCIENRWLLCGHVTDELREQIIVTIVEKAKGMFQWADLQIKYLCGMSDEEDIKENLGRLPETLEGAYAQIYTAILSEKPHALELTKKALMWVMCSQRLLTREEWAEATYWPKEVPNGSFHTLFKLCRNLVTWDSQSDAMRFSHLSVREYLESRFTFMDANSMAAGCCLSRFDLLHSHKFEGQNLSPPRKALARYSTIHWPDHVGYSYNSKHHMSRNMLDLLQWFLGTPMNPGEAYCKWYQSASVLLADTALTSQEYRAIGFLDLLKSTPLNPFFAMSCFGFGEELKEQWQSASIDDFNSKNTMGETLLLVAVKRGNEGMVNLLLENRVDINARCGGGYANPLIAAIKGNHIRILLKLVDAGASIKANESRFTDVLQAAVYYEKMEVIKAIITRDSKPHITEAALVEALMKQNLAIIQLLLENSSGIEITQAVLIEAARNNLSGKEVMEMLLAKDPNIEITEAVMVAAAGNKRASEIMQVLLTNKPNIEITEAVLITAARNKWTGKIIQTLLTNNSNIEITEAVMIAAARNRSTGEIKQMLLTNKSNTGITEAVLIAVTVNEHITKEIMVLLLEKNPNIEITEAVLIVAAKNKHITKEIMVLLLEKNPNVEITEAVLIAAARNEYSTEDIMVLFLQKNPNIKITEAVLIAAARNRSTGDIKQILLTNKSNTEITEAVLIAATENKHITKEIMVLLLEKNPNIEITEAVLIAAARNEYSSRDIMVLFLEKNPNIEITEEVVIAAAGNKWTSEIMQVLLTNSPIEITEAVIAAAAENEWRGTGIMKLLLAENPDNKITQAVLIAAVKSRWGGKMIKEFFLTIDPNIKITEAVITVAAESRWGTESKWGAEKCHEIVKVLLARKQITQAATMATRNERNGKNVKITKATMSAAKRGRIGEGISETPTKKLKTEPIMIPDITVTPASPTTKLRVPLLRYTLVHEEPDTGS